MKDIQGNNRRDFLKRSAMLGAMVVMAPQLVNAESYKGTSSCKKGDGFTFLFQGDSITDGNRTRNSDWNHVMGHGYQFIIASKLWYEHPEKGFKFFNRGVSGNKVPDLAARWQEDALDLRPDLLSILVGINDTEAFFNGDTTFTVDQYEKDYRSLLEKTKKKLPNIQFVLGEPFVLPVGRVKDKWNNYTEDIQKRQEVVRRLAIEYDAVLVGYQKAFNKVLAKAPAEYWIWDGIHPMPAGHELMAREWIRAVGKKFKFIK